MPLDTLPSPRSFGTEPVRPRDPEELRLRDYVDRLRPYKLAILITMTAAAIAAAVFAFTRPVRYDTSAMIASVETDKPQPLVESASLREIISSDNFQTRLKDRLGDGPSVPLSLESIPGTRLMRLHATTTDPERAALAANYATDEIMSIARRVSQNEAEAMRQVIDTQLNASRARLQQLGEALRAFPQVEVLRSEKKVSGDPKGQQIITNEPDRGDRLVNLIVEIEGEKARLAKAQEQLGRTPRTLSAAGRDGANANALVEQAARQAPAAPGDAPVLFDGVTNPVYTVLEYQMTTTRNRIAQLERERDAIVRLLNLSGPDMAQLRQLYGKRMELARLETEYDLAERIYTDVASRGEQTRIDAAGRATGLQLIEKAAKPSSPIPRNALVIVALAILVSGVMAVAAALLHHTVRVA